MTVIVKELRDALVEAGASSEKADAAAEAVAAIEHVATGQDIAGLRTELKTDIAGLRTEIAGLKAELYRAMWLQAGVIIGSVVALIKLLP
jgi:hypothetical protein